MCHFDRAQRAEKSLEHCRESSIQFVWQYYLYPALARRGKDPFDSPPFLLGGSLRVTQRGSLTPVIPSLSRDLLLKYRRYFLRDPSTARLRRSAQDDKRCCTFLYSNCAFQNRILNKRTQFAVCLRLNSERVNAACSYNREPLKRAAQREKRRLAATRRARRLSLQSRKFLSSLLKEIS